MAVGDTFDYAKYVTVADNADASPKVTITPVSVDTSKAGTTIVHITAVDAAGNVSTADMKVIVTAPQKDTTAPVITAKDITVTVGDSFDATQGVSAIDSVDGQVDVKIKSTDVNLSKVGTYHITYTASDKAGNVSDKTITVTVAPKATTGDGGSSSNSNTGSGNSSQTGSNTSSNNDNTSKGSGNSSEGNKGTGNATTGTTATAGVSNVTDPATLSDATTASNTADGGNTAKGTLSGQSESNKTDSKGSLPEASATLKSNTIMQAVLGAISAALVVGIAFVSSKLKKQ